MDEPTSKDQERFVTIVNELSFVVLSARYGNRGYLKIVRANKIDNVHCIVTL